MRRRLTTILLSLAMVVTMMPAMTLTAFAESNWDMLSRALANEEQGSVCGVFDVNDSLGFRDVTLHRNIDVRYNNLVVEAGVFLDLNHHQLKNMGAITNNGNIILHREDAALYNYLINNVTGCYSNDEKLAYPSRTNPDYVIPEGTFMSVEIGNNPTYYDMGFASGNEPLIWNRDIKAGTQFDVTYALTLGGDILAAKSSDTKATMVSANFVKLNDNISIGSNDADDCEAILSVESIHSEMTGDTIGTFDANGKTITLNLTGKVVVSDDVEFDSSVILSGVEGLNVCKLHNDKNHTDIYRLDAPLSVAAKSTKTSQGYKSVKLTWNKIPGATKYVVYGAKSGKSFKKLATTNKLSYTVKKLNGNKIKKNAKCKFKVVAYSADGKLAGKTI